MTNKISQISLFILCLALTVSTGCSSKTKVEKPKIETPKTDLQVDTVHINNDINNDSDKDIKPHKTDQPKAEPKTELTTDALDTKQQTNNKSSTTRNATVYRGEMPPLPTGNYGPEYRSSLPKAMPIGFDPADLQLLSPEQRALIQKHGYAAIQADAETRQTVQEWITDAKRHEAERLAKEQAEQKQRTEKEQAKQRQKMRDDILGYDTAKTTSQTSETKQSATDTLGEPSK